MPGSGQPEEASARSEADRTARLLERFGELEAAVERLLTAHVRLRERVERLETLEEQLRGAVAGEQLDALDPGKVEERLHALARENRRLREVVEEGRERAERMRSRLIALEDES